MSPERLAYGVLGYDLAHLLAAAALVMSFVLLYQRRIDALVNTYAVQAWILSAAAFWQGWVQASPHLYASGVIALAAKGIAIPLALHNIIRRLRIQRGIDTAMGVFPSMALGVAMVTLAFLAVLPSTPDSQVLTREDLAIALSIVLLGLVMMISRTTALTQVVGFMSLENGLILAAVSVTGMPLVVELSVAVLVLVAAIVFGVFFFRIRARFDSLDISHLDQVGRSNR